MTQKKNYQLSTLVESTKVKTEPNDMFKYLQNKKKVQKIIGGAFTAVSLCELITVGVIKIGTLNDILSQEIVTDNVLATVATLSVIGIGVGVYTMIRGSPISNHYFEKEHGKYI
ncbi:MAG: hypothetical protein HRU03_08950 [Nanoarchaeales archaeon]|nr:hypothetical protein [Nanoarchaeales archaeon]